MSSNKTKSDIKTGTEFISLSEAAKKSGYTPEYLNLSARKGKLEAQKIGRNWHTTNEWLEAFLNLATVKKNEKKEDVFFPAEVEDVAVKPEEENIPEVIAMEEMGRGRENIVEMIEGTFDFSQAGKKMSKKASHRSWVQILAGASTMIIIIPVVFFLTYSVKYYAAQKKYNEKKIALLDQSPVGVIMNENESDIFSQNAEEEILGVVQGEETTNDTADTEAEKKSGVVLASENFKAQNVSMGVGIVLADAEENVGLEISDIKSESFITGKKSGADPEEVKLVVSWKTNKLAMSELDLSKNNGQDKKVLKEQTFGFNHAVVLSQIDPRTSYVYQIKSKDHWGMEVGSDLYGIFTASKPTSIFDLISEQINGIFGWVIKD